MHTWLCTLHWYFEAKEDAKFCSEHWEGCHIFPLQLEHITAKQDYSIPRYWTPTKDVSYSLTEWERQAKTGWTTFSWYVYTVEFSLAGTLLIKLLYTVKTEIVQPVIPLLSYFFSMIPLLIQPHWDDPLLATLKGFHCLCKTLWNGISWVFSKLNTTVANDLSAKTSINLLLKGASLRYDNKWRLDINIHICNLQERQMWHCSVKNNTYHLQPF